MISQDWVPGRETPGTFNRILHLATMIVVNAIPLTGWFIGGWTAGTTLAVYWFETVVASLFVALRALLHKRWNPRRGHFRYEAPGPDRRYARTSFVTGFLFTTLVFSAAHGFFLAVIVLLLTHNGKAELIGIDWRSVGFGCLQVLIALAADFLVDLPSLRRWTFWQLEVLASRGFLRVAVVHLTLIFGMFAVAVTDAPSALFSVFVALKTMYSLSTTFPQWEPATPPRWLSTAMNRIPSARPGLTFEQQWAKDRRDEAARRKKNDEPWTEAKR
ncbi:DUF6498-containing protein [Mycobacteroides immunogenum]|uniref:Uncharacterized protein n=1 Tax=Mycobacteroides immunogenum TaxID=83262 RepID=A0A7V8RY76_9MYCO|nr:DUF6498-containing protein [Mycobacteroides immunogenum]AMT71319.1 hypothetical protein ABG82_14375 [Mycobacteroides immunogenum]ANO04428.1 hypothetical protein BAB75_14600 [Mycobacteroides immunogenum]KPG14923.1 hypothetical protein AN909_00630 [Mycobacteroides immunogenum]KPG15539.1 hypothetical protein AN910_05780 [Mycobacteroides immunogenum]KPG16469.1 hypothetical protein AN908_05840 [Mycobacteroides immunogenum]